MKNEILNLADNIELEGDKRKMFIEEMEWIMSVMKKPNYEDFYDVVDIVMQKIMDNETI